ncbi:hypothetical protein M408DRAFT_214418 [Serendipita vermifera MAFF 305830]|uniref:Methyltransferase domain-containing protein n=1 Tax=Serendipita vermifera MAFF 305830 TaxID=933852 RepID=A0A0C3BL16_SERVB|nr:hypothetical protein M408DRAFT_214418 [Serendipita vermifera MAFF 305830]
MDVDNRPLFTGNLPATLEYQESLYQEQIVRRKKLIEHWSAQGRELKIFPDHGEFYTIWDFVTPTFSCPFPVRRIGTLGDGGKYVCGFHRVTQGRGPERQCVVYSFGVSDESSFEAEILASTNNCQVYGYDFSVKHWGPQLHNNPAYDGRVHFEPYKLGGKDDSFSIPEVHTLGGLMQMNGHTFIDILKIDIEGSEFDLLNTLLDAHFASGNNEPLPFGQLQLEIHLWHNNLNFNEFLTFWERLEKAGLRPFWTEPNLIWVNALGQKPGLSEWSFINTRAHHALTVQ